VPSTRREMRGSCDRRPRSPIAGKRRGPGIGSFEHEFVAIFSAIKVFTWTGTLYRGAISFRTPLLYVLVFIFFFVFGGMAGVALATVVLDAHWHDGYFVVAHFHFIMVGGTITGYLAALHSSFPKMFGPMYPERLGLLSAALVFWGSSSPSSRSSSSGMPAFPGATRATRRSSRRSTSSRPCCGLSKRPVEKLKYPRPPARRYRDGEVMT
jgi:hypothetical protein